jgi:hypothetical protein
MLQCTPTQHNYKKINKTKTKNKSKVERLWYAKLTVLFSGKKRIDYNYMQQMDESQKHSLRKSLSHRFSI